MTYLEKISSIPIEPGIYIFFDVNDVALYIGTSTKLHNRIKTHFTNLTNVNPLEIIK